MSMNDLNPLHILRRFKNLFGTTHNGSRDLYEVFGYSRNPTFMECMVKFTRQGVAGRIIDAPASALWTDPPQITSNDTAWDQTWKDICVQTHLWERVGRADRLAGIGKYSILLIGFNDGLPLDKPVNAAKVRTQKKKILYIQPYSIESAKIEKLLDNPQHEHHMQPEMYKINPKSDINPLSQPEGTKGPNVAQHLAPFNVHYSRIVHVCENPLENEIYGNPRLERVFNLLDDLLKVTGGTAETFWLAGNRGMQIDIDKELALNDTDEKALSDEIEEYIHNLRRVIRTRGVKINNLGADVPDPTGTYNVIIQELAGGTGIPRRILTGSEAGQLASEQDRANWADRVVERRTEFGTPRVIFPLINRLTIGGALTIKDANTFTITIHWPEAYHLSPLEKAQTAAQHARSATNFAKAIETMAKLNQGTPGTPDTTDPNGNTIPGTPGEPGLNLADLVTVDEARKFIGLDKPEVTADGASDVNDATSSQG